MSLETSNVLVCHGNTILDMGILDVLRAIPRLTLSQIITNDISRLHDEIETTHPHVVIISQGSEIPKHPQFRSLLAHFQDVRVLTICDESNLININHRQLVEIHRATDIIDLVLNQSQADKIQENLEEGCK